MATTVTVPSFEWASFYYPELLEALIQYKRQNVPELTDESEFEPFIQLLRAFALVGHINNVNIDLVANESTLPTAQLVETVRNMLRLIGYELSPAAPAQADLVYELTRVFVAATEIVSPTAQAATARQGDVAPVFFEALEALTVVRTDQHTHAYAAEDGVFTDYTTEANSPTTPADDWTPWATPAVKDAIYWGHTNVMWDVLGAVFTTPAAGITGVFEFYDGEYAKTAPTGVTDLGTSLEFDLTSLLGLTNRQGTQVRVQFNESTAFQDVESTWTGTKNIATTGLLGQTSPSTDPTKYSVGSDWTILEDIDDGTNNLQQDGTIEYPLPQTLTQDWKRTEVNGQTAFWIRYRILTVAAATPPTIQRTRMDEGKQYAKRTATQGRSRTEDPLGSSTGLADQRFVTGQDYFINNSETVTVDGETWTRVDNFLSSEAADKHYRIELGDNDRATVVFGDGTTGRIPPLGVANVAISYRYGAESDGNVGANTINVDKTGLTFVARVWNPRQAAGWSEAEGSTATSLERAKIAGPASLRVKDVALSPDDAEVLAEQYVDDSGASPFGRALAFEEGFGPKTIMLVVVAKGGGLATAAQLEALDAYFNGDDTAVPPTPKRIVANQELTSINYTPVAINITATVYGDTTAEAVLNRLAQVLQPEALKADGATYEWNFGEDVPRNRIIHEIFETDESITNVTLTAPASDVALGTRELPVLGAVTITIAS